MRTTILGWIVVSVMALTVAAIIRFARSPKGQAIHPVSDKEERAAAEDLLAAKLSGPQYFTPKVVSALEDCGHWIEVSDAWSQVPRIVAERHISPSAEQSLERLISKLSEPHPYRVVGGQRINLLRLNLSLDALPVALP